MNIQLTEEEKKLLSIACSLAVGHYQQQKFHMTGTIPPLGSEHQYQALVDEYDNVVKSFQQLRTKLTNQ